MKKIILILLFVMLPVAALAEDTAPDQPHWSFEVKGGNFTPTLSNWREFYGKRSMPEYGATLAYKLVRQVEIGVGAGAMSATGTAFAPLHQIAAGKVTYSLYPISLSLVLRGIVNENQWIVPYVGGSFTRMYYEEKIEGQGTAHGKADGYGYRGGLQFLLDGLDPDAANSMYLEYGVFHTYFFVEAEKTTAKVTSASADLGGTAYLFGLLFEF